MFSRPAAAVAGDVAHVAAPAILNHFHHRPYAQAARLKLLLPRAHRASQGRAQGLGSAKRIPTMNADDAAERFEAQELRPGLLHA